MRNFRGGGTLLAEKVNAKSVTDTYITFNEANAYDTSVKVIYYDADNNGTRNSEVMIYSNGRFNPMATTDAALWWAAPEAGKVTVEKKTITLNIEVAKVENTDGVRYALLKVDSAGKTTSLTDGFWNELKCTTESGKNSKETHYVATANYGGDLNVTVDKGEKIAIVINCGTAGNNSLDQPIVTASMKFTPTAGTETTYAFETSFLSSQVTALTGSQTFAMGMETTNYYSWGAATFSEKGTITADKEKNDFTQTNVMDGKAEKNLVYKEAGLWNIDGVSSTYHVAITGTTAKIHAPSNLHDTQLVWKATTDGVFSLDSLTLYMKDESTNATCDGMKYAVLYKDSDGKYYDLYTTNQIDGDAPWHDLVWKQQQEINDLFDFAMKEGEEFILMFNRKNSAALDPCMIDIKISFAEENGSIKEYTIGQNTSKIETQGVNGFYFRDVYTPATVTYKTAKGDVLKTENVAKGSYTLIGGESFSLSDGEQFVGWRNTAKKTLYNAGASYGLADTSAEFTAVIITLKTENTAGLRLSEELSDAGIRFVTKFDLSALNSKDYTFGTIIAPEDKITDNDLFVKGGTLTVADVPAVNYKTEENGEFTQNAVLKNLKDNNYNRNMKARGYVTVTYADKTTKTFYSNVSDGKSAAYVANELYNWFETTFKDALNYEQLNSVITAYKNAYQA